MKTMAMRVLQNRECSPQVGPCQCRVNASAAPEPGKACDPIMCWLSGGSTGHYFAD